MENIGMVLQSNFPPDIRVEKEAKVLLKAGYKVFLLTRSTRGELREELVNGVHVRRTKYLTPFIRNMNLFLFYLTFSHPIWKKEINNFVKDFKINILHIHDLPLVKNALGIAKKICVPVVADLHENYPAALQVYIKDSRKKLTGKLIKPLAGFRRWTNYENKYLKQVDQIITVVQEAKDRLVKYGILGERISIVSNTVDLNYFGDAKIRKSIVEKYKDWFVILYCGGLGSHRGIDCAIKAMKYVSAKINKAKLLLVGSKEGAYLEKMRLLTRRCNIDKHVEFVKWQPAEIIPNYIKASDVCLVPHNMNPHTDTTIPHKLFQYMLGGKPVLVSSCKPLKRIVEETNSGLVFEAGRERNLADKILVLYNDGLLRKKLGENGIRAVKNQYNWWIDSKELISLYRKLSL